MIGNGCFSDCAGLTLVDIGSSVSSLGDNSFSGCLNLPSFSIPSSVTSLGNGCFSDCTGLTLLSYEWPENINSVAGVEIGIRDVGIRDVGIRDVEVRILQSGSSLEVIFFNTPSAPNAPNPALGVYDTSLYEAGSIFTYYVGSEALPISNICFPSGTLISTDQGECCINELNVDYHTINKMRIVGVTETISNDNHLICFGKDSLGLNIPSKNTIMSKNHSILYNGKMCKAKVFVKLFKNVYKVKYERDILYNVLMYNADSMLVNNLICETLDPINTMAKMYIFLSKLNLSDKNKFITGYNNYVNKSNIFK